MNRDREDADMYRGQRGVCAPKQTKIARAEGDTEMEQPNTQKSRTTENVCCTKKKEKSVSQFGGIK